MTVAFRIECPHCKWGVPWSDRYVNQGWLRLSCGHCDRPLFAKVSVPTVDVQVRADEPEQPVKDAK